jgi:hypothetical protein
MRGSCPWASSCAGGGTSRPHPARSTRARKSEEPRFSTEGHAAYGSLSPYARMSCQFGVAKTPGEPGPLRTSEMGLGARL